jgi:hypothetical protein
MQQFDLFKLIFVNAHTYNSTHCIFFTIFECVRHFSSDVCIRIALNAVNVF